MAHSTIIFKNPNSGGIKEAPVGFSWTTMFFGGFPALLRGHIGLGVIQIILQIATSGISAVIFAFFYNKMYIKYLVGEGFKVKDITSLKDKEALFAEIEMELEELAEN